MHIPNVDELVRLVANNRYLNRSKSDTVGRAVLAEQVIRREVLKEFSPTSQRGLG